EFETRGDRDQTSKLGVHGGKGGAFVQELRAAMQAGEIQAIMHSLKDVPGNEEIDGVVIGAYLKRANPFDALIVRPGFDWQVAIDDQKPWRIGTNSERR